MAERWRSGLGRSGLGGSDLTALRGAADVTIYTPGSTAGVPLNVIGELRAPADGNAESAREEAAALASGLLELVRVDADPLSSPAHILISNLVEQAWAKGQDLDLPALLARIMDPPFRKLGVFELDVFFPAEDSRKLAMRLNALLASRRSPPGRKASRSTSSRCCGAPMAAPVRPFSISPISPTRSARSSWRSSCQSW